MPEPRDRSNVSGPRLFTSTLLIVAMALLLSLGLLGPLAPPQQAQAQPDLDLPEVPDADTWTTNEPVMAMATDGDVTYIGGYFDRVGPNTGHGVMFDATDGTMFTPYLRINDSVYTSIGDGAGGYFVGGYFSGAGGLERNGIAHILADGSVDPDWNPRVEEGSLRAMTLMDGVLYIGGYFNSVDGQRRYCLAALDAGTGDLLDWNPMPNSDVASLASADGIVYAGGWFSNIGGQSRNYVAALDATTGLATDWDPNANSPVLDFALSGSTIYVCGYFTTIGGQSRYCLAALDAATGLATAWNPGPNSNVYDIDVCGSTLYVGGYFNWIGGQSRQYLAAVDKDTGLATAWNPGPNSNIEALDVSDAGDTVYVGGYFSSVGGQDRNHLAAIDAGTGLATGWDPNPDDNVLTITAEGDGIFAGGHFLIMGGVERQGLAALDASGIATDFNPWVEGEVEALEYANGLLYVGGGFDEIGGQDRYCLAALDPATGLATDWDPQADDYVYSLQSIGNTIYAAGEFTSVGGQDRYYLAAIDATTGLATDWDPSPGDYVYDLDADGGVLYAGGMFTSIGGQERGYIAALDPVTGLATGWNPGASDFVVKVQAINGQVYAGGFFDSIGGAERSCVAALDPVTGSANPWNPGADFFAMAFAPRGDLMYTGGGFTFTGGKQRFGLAAVDATGTSNDWDPNQMPMYYYYYSEAGAEEPGGILENEMRKTIQQRMAEEIGDAGEKRGYSAERDDAQYKAYYYYGQVSDLLLAGNTLYVAGFMYTMGYYSVAGLCSFTDPSLDWYMAEGATDGGMETWILVENPNAYDVKVDLSFDTENGLVTPPELQNLTIPANSRSSFNAGAFVTSYQLSTELTSRGGQVFCERALYGEGKAWSSSADGATATNSAWYMAEGTTEGGMSTWVLAQNPNDFPVNVDVTFLTDTGEYQPAELQNYRIAPHQRASFNVGEYVGTFDVSTKVVSRGGGVVCERSTYGPRTDGEGLWATSSSASRGPSTSWYLAEGATDEGRETWVLVENPYEVPVDVDVKFMTGQGEVQGPVETIPAKTRRSYNAGDYVTAFDVATTITASGGDVVCERAMYGTGRSWATTSNGSSVTATVWNMAEGSTKDGMETWIVVLNPGDADTKIFASFQTDEGLVEPSELQNLTLAAGARFTLRVKDYVTSYNVSTRVEAASGVVCERATYGPVGGEGAGLGTWATSSEGFHCDGP